MRRHIANTLAGWAMVEDLPAPRRRRFRPAFVLYFVGLRRLALMVSGR
jgi:hypothetical protein